MVTNNINDVVKMLEDEIEVLKKRPNRSDMLDYYINGIEHSIMMIRMECKDIKFEDPIPFSPQIRVTPVYGCKIPIDSYPINSPSSISTNSPQASPQIIISSDNISTILTE